MTTQEVIDYYTSLLIVQYASLPNARATVAALMNRLIQDQIIAQVRDGFNLDTAIGAQIDILGKYRGIPRTLFGATQASDWSLINYSDYLASGYFGWAEYADADPNWLWMQYDDVASLPYTLTDVQMVKLIKLAAKIDGSSMDLGTIDAILFEFFGTYVTLLDNQNMSIVYEHVAADPDPDTLWDIAVLAGVLPHPSGVAFSTVEV